MPFSFFLFLLRVVKYIFYFARLIHLLYINTSNSQTFQIRKNLHAILSVMQMLPLVAAALGPGGAWSLLILACSLNPPSDQFLLRVCTCPLLYMNRLWCVSHNFFWLWCFPHYIFFCIVFLGSSNTSSTSLVSSTSSTWHINEIELAYI